jgi:hypothetical protein
MSKSPSGNPRKVGLGLPETDAVRADGEGAGNDLHDRAVVGNRRGEVPDIGVRDQRLRGTLLKKAAAGRSLRGDGIDARIDFNLLHERANRQRDRNMLRLPIGSGRSPDFEFVANPLADAATV